MSIEIRTDEDGTEVYVAAGPSGAESDSVALWVKDNLVHFELNGYGRIYLADLAAIVARLKRDTRPDSFRVLGAGIEGIHGGPAELLAVDHPSEAGVTVRWTSDGILTHTPNESAADD